MARHRDWQQLELCLPIVGDVHQEYAPTSSRSIPKPQRESDPDRLTDAALLTTILGPSTKSARNALLASYGSLRRLSQAHRIDRLRVYYDVQEEPQQVVKVRGSGSRIAMRFASAAR